MGGLSQEQESQIERYWLKKQEIFKPVLMASVRVKQLNIEASY